MYRYVYLDENENFVKIDAGECMYVTIELLLLYHNGLHEFSNIALVPLL